MDQSDYGKLVLAHYRRSDVRREIVRYSESRWVAVHCEIVNSQGYRVLLRYQRGTDETKVPLAIAKLEDVPNTLNRFKRLGPRTFYASACVYKELSGQEHVRDLKNILYCSPTWDIDNTPNKCKATIEAAKAITAFLRDEGVHKSVFVKWSGRGAHVHLHHKAFSQPLLDKIPLLDVAYATVEFVNRRLRTALARISQRYNAPELGVENEIDLQRVFTCPLSLHRDLNSVAICIPPDRIDDFRLEWTKVDGYLHWDSWDRYELGEADALAEKAFRAVGKYQAKTLRKLETKTQGPIEEWFGTSVG